ncbi:MAG: protein kinase, partial [Eggerthellaceae bacterium]|nr:protein kinase [Eggerthellaceae bacterium]
MNEDSLHQDLSSYLQAREERDRYRVDAVLKESPFEITQRVYRCNPDGSEDGPYVRKIFSGEADKRQVGGTYGLLWREQQAGGEMLNLPRLYGVYDAIDSLEVLMEYVGGTSLRSRILAHPERRMALTATVFPQVCDAVASLHDALAGPIIHRDITPSNVMCDGADDGRVRAVLVDFGVARVHKREATADTAHFGTAAYAAPEQYGFRQTDVRTDVYGLGALLSFCLMARDPVQSGGEGECCLSGAPEALAAVARKAMAFDPDDRYQTARELKEAFLCAL